MKAVSYDILSVYLACPYCGANWVNSEGSYVWSVIDDISVHGLETVTCPACQKKSKIPKRLAEGG
jgi:ribosomal protein L37AE/L43A